MRIPFGSSVVLSAVVVSVLLFATQSAQATLYYWDNNGATSGFGAAGGTWSASASLWSTDSNGLTVPTGSVATTTADSLNFGTGVASFGLGTGTITVSGTVNAATFTASGQSASITLNGGTIAMGTTAGSISTGANALIITSALTGSAGLTKAGSKVLTLSGNNTYTGGTTISVNILKVGSATALGDSTSAVSITSGAALDLGGTTMTNTNALTLRGTGVSSGGALMNSSATAGTYAGLVSLGTASSIIAGTGNITLSNTGTITGSNLGLTVGGAKNTTIASIIGTGTGTLTKQDGGTLTVSGANTYTGLTTVSAGELDLNTTGSQAIAGNLTVSGGTAKLLQASQINSAKNLVVSGGTFDIQGFNQTLANVQLTSGTISGSGGTLTSANAYDMQAGSVSTILGGSGIALNKTTSGTVTLSAANTYTGTTTVTLGTLLLSNSSSVSDTSSVVVNGGTLNSSVSNVNLGTGTVSMSSGNITPGGIGTVGSFTLASGQNFSTTGGTLNFDLSSAISFDKIIGAGAGTFSLANTTLALSGLTSATGTYQLFSGFTTGTNTISNLTITGLTSGYSGSLDTAGLLTVVPEPATWALLAFSLTTVTILRRRRA